MVTSAADSTSTLIELNEKKTTKGGKRNNGYKWKIKEAIQSTILELNDKTQSYETKIAELNTKIEEKDAEIAEKDTKISELNASIEQIQATLDKLNQDYEIYWAERSVLESELAKAKVAEKLGELDSALGWI